MKWECFKLIKLQLGELWNEALKNNKTSFVLQAKSHFKWNILNKLKNIFARWDKVKMFLKANEDQKRWKSFNLRQLQHLITRPKLISLFYSLFTSLTHYAKYLLLLWFTSYKQKLWCVFLWSFYSLWLLTRSVWSNYTLHNGLKTFLALKSQPSQNDLSDMKEERTADSIKQTSANRLGQWLSLRSKGKGEYETNVPLAISESSPDNVDSVVMRK